MSFSYSSSIRWRTAILSLGFDDIVLVTGNHDAAQLQELHELTVSSR